MKKFFTLFLGLIFCACSGPSKIAPTVSSFTILGINTGKKLSIPIPEAFTFKLDNDWILMQNVFSLEESLMAFSFVKGNEEVTLRGGKKEFLYKDSSFTIEIDTSDEAFINYYLKWDFDYAASRHEVVKQAETTGPIYDREKKLGFIKSTNDKYQRCVMAAIVNGSIYMLTGRANESDKDICKTIIDIWESRESF